MEEPSFPQHDLCEENEHQPDAVVSALLSLTTDKFALVPSVVSVSSDLIWECLEVEEMTVGCRASSQFIRKLSLRSRNARYETPPRSQQSSVAEEEHRLRILTSGYLSHLRMGKLAVDIVLSLTGERSEVLFSPLHAKVPSTIVAMRPGGGGRRETRDERPQMHRYERLGDCRET